MMHVATHCYIYVVHANRLTDTHTHYSCTCALRIEIVFVVSDVCVLFTNNYYN